MQTVVQKSLPRARSFGGVGKIAYLKIASDKDELNWVKLGVGRRHAVAHCVAAIGRLLQPRAAT
jgi:hypothetical protein